MKKVGFALILVVAAIGLAACGGSSSSSSAETSEGGAATESEGGGAAAEGGSPSRVKLEADPNGELAYVQKSVTAKAGEVTIDFNNPQPLEHDVVIENSAGETIGETELVAEGSTSTVVELKPGTYHYYCSVPGHRDAGMEGTLTVK